MNLGAPQASEQSISAKVGQSYQNGLPNGRTGNNANARCRVRSKQVSLRHFRVSLVIWAVSNFLGLAHLIRRLA